MNSEELAANVDDQHPMGRGCRSDDSMNDERIFKVSRYSHFLSMGNNHGGLSKSIRRTEPTSSTNIPVTNISILCLRDEYLSKNSRSCCGSKRICAQNINKLE